MFTLTAGRLSLIDVAMELHVPRDVPADHWSLLETCGGQTVQLEHCLLTIHNATDQLKTYHQEVAFIRAKPSPDADTAIDGAQSATPLTTLELSACVARGEAVFLHVEDLQPVKLKWENGFLATTEQLLWVGGGLTAPKSEETLRMDLRHLTAVVRGGLCRLAATPSAPYQQAVQFSCADDVFITLPGVPLVAQDGVTDVGKARQRFAWNGDRNFYQDADVFWTVRSDDPRVLPDSMTFDGWTTYWGAVTREPAESFAAFVDTIARGRAAVACLFAERLHLDRSNVQRRAGRRAWLAARESSKSSARAGVEMVSSF